MKKIIAFFLVFLIATSMISCSSGVTDNDPVLETTPAETEQTTTTVQPVETTPNPMKHEDAIPYIPAAGDTATVTNLGNLTKTIYIRMNDGGYDKDGTPVLYFVTDGNPNALFVIINAVTGKILREFKLEHSTGAWEVFVHSSKNVYISGHGKPYFYIYNYEEDKIENVGELPSGSSLGQVMCEGDNGIVYSGSTDSSTYWGYDPNTKKLFSMPTLIGNATRHPAVAYDPVDKQLYVSILSKDSKNLLFRVDPVTMQNTDITPAEYRDKGAEYNFYDMHIYGDILVIRYPTTQEMLFFDIRNNELVEFKNEISGASSKVVKTLCRQPAADPEDPTKFYTVISGKLAVFDTVSRTYSITKTNATSSFIRMVFLKLGDKYEGWSACSLYGHSGGIQFSNLSSNLSQIITTDVSGQPNVPNCLALTKNGLLYIGGGYGGSTGIYNVNTGESALFNKLGQQEGMVAYNNLMYFGTYPKAIIHAGSSNMSSWSVNSILSMESSSTIPGYEHQDRPYTFLSIPEEKLIAICSVPAQGSYTGAIALLNAGSVNVRKHASFPIANQSGVSMAYKDGVIYIGTTTRAGYGTSSKAKKAKLLAYDIAEDSFTEYELPMNPANAVTALTIAGDGKLWGFAYNFLFCFDTEKREFVSYKQQDITCNNEVWREFTLTPGDETCIFASCAYTKTLYRVSLEDMIAYPVAVDAGWHHIMDNYGNFYLLNDINVNKVSFTK